MTTPPKLTPCEVGLRCKTPETCDHTFVTPDQIVGRLHPEDFFADPDDPDIADDLDAQAAARTTQARALWACKLDCPARPQCLALGMQPGPTLQHGIFGGYTAPQRREIVRERARRVEEEARRRTAE